MTTLGSKIKSALKTASKVGVAALGALTTGTAAMTGALFKGAKETAEYGDEIDKMSQKLGLSAEAYQKWDYVLSQSGADISSMSTGLKTLTNKLDEAKNGGAGAQEMFAKLGLSMDELSTMSREDVFGAVITGFQGMADSTERAALANDLFGRSGQELAPLFNESIESTQQLMQAAEDLGFVMSDDAVKASADFQDALDTLQRTFGGLKNSLMGDFMPSVTKVMEGLTALFGGDGSSGLALIKEGINEMVQSLSDKLPDFIQLGTDIVLSLGEAIVDNLPTLLQAGVDAFLSVVDGILKNVDKLVATATQLILVLAGGLIKAIPKLVAAVPQLISALVRSFLSLGKEFLNIGSQLVEGIKQGISNAWGGLIKKATSLGKSLLGKVKGLFGIHSPSTVFAGIGKNMAAGLGVGWEKEFLSVQRDITDGLDFTGAVKSPTLNVNSTANGSAGAMNGNSAITLDLPVILDTGLLVGGIAQTMNRTLGRTYVQNVRGSMA